MAGEAEVERLLVRLVGDASDYQKMLRDAQTATVKANKGIAAATRRMVQQVAASLTTAGRAFQKFGRGLQSVGRSLSLRLTAPLVLMGGIAVKSFADFNKAMTESLAIMDVTSEQAERMTQTAIDIGTKGIKGPKDLAEAYFFLASAGLDAEQSMTALPAIVDFATSGAFDMALATDLLTDAQTALGLASTDAGQNLENLTRISDAFVKANQLANTSVQQISEAMTADAGTASKNFGQELETTVAVLSAYASAGKKGAEAGNLFGRATRLLTKAQRDNSKDFKALGITVIDEATGKYRNFIDILGDMENAFKGMTDPQRDAALETLGFAALAQKSITPLLGLSDTMRGYETALKAAGGATKEVAGKQLKSFSNQMLILKNQLTAVAIQVGEILAPAIGKLSEFIKRGVDAWNSFSDSTKKTIVIIAAVVAVVGPLLIAFGGMISLAGFALTGIALAITWIGAAIAFLVSPIGLALAAFAAVSVAVAALTVAIVAHVAHLIGPNGMKAAWNAILFAIGALVNKALGFLENFGQNVAILTVWFATNWKTMLTDVLKASVIFADNMIDNVATIATTGIGLMLNFSRGATRLLMAPFTKESAILIGSDFASALAHTLSKGLDELKTPFEGFESSVEGPVLNFTRRVTEDAIPEDEIAESLGDAVKKATDKIGITSIPITIPVAFTTARFVEFGSFEDLANVAQSEIDAANVKMQIQADPEGNAPEKIDENKPTIWVKRIFDFIVEESAQNKNERDQNLEVAGLE